MPTRPVIPIPSWCYPAPADSDTIARRLLLEIDTELSQGHHAAAERLAWRAAELRGAA